MHHSILELYKGSRPNIAVIEFLANDQYVLNVFSSRLLFSNEKAKIFFQEGLSHSSLFWGQYEITSKDLFITTLPWFTEKKDFQLIADIISKTQPLGKSALDQFLICCNDSAEVVDARSVGFSRSFLIHQNCFLDENLYRIIQEPTAEKKYYLVMNTRPEIWKRPFFATEIRNLAVIKGANFRPNEYFDLESLKPAFINDVRLTTEQVVEVLNQSFCGGIFSECEGGNYSSGEYFLCGLPVVSTPSKGGRDEYFCDDNHELVYEPSDVISAVTDLVNRQISERDYGLWVRNQMLKTSSRFLKTLFHQVNLFMQQAGISSANFEQIYKAEYTNKMVIYSRIPQ